MRLLTRRSYVRLADHYISRLSDLDAFDWGAVAADQLVVLSLNDPRHFNRLLDEFMTRLSVVATPSFRLLTIEINGQIPLGVVQQVLASTAITHWYTENWSHALRHPKLTIVPIGVAEAFRGQWSEADWTPPSNKRLRCVSTFQHGVPVIPRSGSPNDRLDCLQAWKGNAWVYWAPKLPLESYIRVHAEYAFSVSPLGTRLDCHRTWEILACGCIPIVKRSTLLPLWREFPIVVVDDWADVDAERLETWHRELAGRFDPSVLERLTEDYWYRRIRGEQTAPKQSLQAEADEEWSTRSEAEIVPKQRRLSFFVRRNAVLWFIRYLWIRVATHREVEFDLREFLGDFKRVARDIRLLLRRA